MVFQHVLFLTSSRNHIVSLCRKCKVEHDKMVSGSMELEESTTIRGTERTAEDIMADSAILIIKRLLELDSIDANEALRRVRKTLK